MIKTVEGEIADSLFSRLQSTLDQLCGPGQVDLTRIRLACLELLCCSTFDVFLSLHKVRDVVYLLHIVSLSSQCVWQSRESDLLLSIQKLMEHGVLDNLQLLPDGLPRLVRLRMVVAGKSEVVDQLKSAERCIGVCVVNQEGELDGILDDVESEEEIEDDGDAQVECRSSAMLGNTDCMHRMLELRMSMDSWILTQRMRQHGQLLTFLNYPRAVPCVGRQPAGKAHSQFRCG